MVTGIPNFASYLAKKGLAGSVLTQPDLKFLTGQIAPAQPAPIPPPNLLNSTQQMPQSLAEAEMLLRLAGANRITPPVTAPVPQAELIAQGANNSVAGIPLRNDPIGRFEAQSELMRQGTHQGAVGDQLKATAATILQLPLMAADVPRQEVVASGGEGFVDQLTKYGDWGAIYLVMSNLGAANKSNPLAQRSPQEQAILPEQFGSDVVDTRSIDQRQQEYAAYMSSLPPDQQAQVRQEFDQWLEQKRNDAYTPGRADLKHAVSFEEWQGLNYDKALDVYLRGWQAPQGVVLGPDGQPLPPQQQPANGNPAFVGGQAVWEAYINELDPKERVVQDFAHDPTILPSIIGGAARAGGEAVIKAAPEAAAVAKAMQGVGTVGDVLTGAGNANIVGLLAGTATAGAPGLARFAGRKLAPTAVGDVARAVAGSAPARFSARLAGMLRAPFSESERMTQGYTPTANALQELYGVSERGGVLRASAPGTTPPVGRIDLAGAQAAQREAGTTSFNQAEADALRRSSRRVSPEVPENATLHRWLRNDPHGATSVYYADPHLRAAERQVTGPDGFARRQYQVEAWSSAGEGSWQPISDPITIEGAMTPERAQRRVLRTLTDEAEADRNLTLYEVGAPLSPDEVHVEWTGPETARYFMDVLDAMDYSTIYPEGSPQEERMLELHQEIRNQLPPGVDVNDLENNAAYATVPLVLRASDFDTIRDMHARLGQNPPLNTTQLTPDQLARPGSRLLSLPARATAAPIALPEGRWPMAQTIPLPGPEGSQNLLPGTVPSPQQQALRPIIAPETAATVPPPAEVVRDLGQPPAAQPPAQITPAQIDIGLQQGTGINGTSHDILKAGGNADLKAALSGFQEIGRGRGSSHRGTLTPEQIDHAIEVLQADHEAHPGPEHSDRRRSVRESITRLQQAASGAEPQISPASLPAVSPTFDPFHPPQVVKGPPLIPEPPRVELGTPPPLERHVQLHPVLADYLVNLSEKRPDLITPELADKLRSGAKTTSTRGKGEVLEVILNDDDADQIRGVHTALESKSEKGIAPGDTYKNARRYLGGFDDLYTKSPEAGYRPPLPTSMRPQPSAPPVDPMVFDRNAPVAAEQERVLAARQAGNYQPPLPEPSSPAAVRAVLEERAKGTTTSKIADAIAFARNRQQTHYATDLTQALPPPDQSVPFTPSSGFRSELNPDRQALAPGPSHPELDDYQRRIIAAANGPQISDPAGLSSHLTTLATQGTQDYLASLDRSRGPVAEIEGALQRADTILDMLRTLDEADPTGRWRQDIGGEFAFGAGRSSMDYPSRNVVGDPHGDFDAVLRGIFGGSRENKVSKATGAPSGVATSAESVVGQLTNSADPGAQRLAAEIDQRRREYLDLVGKAPSDTYYGSVIPGGPQIAGGIQGAAKAVTDFIGQRSAGPAAVEPRFLPTNKAPLDLVSEDARTALSQVWTNPKTPYAGMTTADVFQDVHNQVVADQAEYAQLLSQEGPLPDLKIICPDRKHCRLDDRALNDAQKRMLDLEQRWRYAIPLGKTLDSIDARTLTINGTLEEYLREIGEVKPGEMPDNWVINTGRWVKGTYTDLGAASSQFALHSPASFRYMAQNWVNNPLLMATKYPRTGLRQLLAGEFRAGVERGTRGTFSPLQSLLKLTGKAADEQTLTYAEQDAARWLTTVNREAGISQKFAVEKAARGSRQLVDRFGGRRVRIGNNTVSDIVGGWYERGAARNIAHESEQRIAGWHSRAKERLMEAWMAHQQVIADAVGRQGLTLDMAQLRRKLPPDPGGFELYDAVFTEAQSQGFDEQRAMDAAQAAYDAWRTPSMRAINVEAINDIKGPMVLNRKTPLDKLVGGFIPFTMWNSRITKYLLGQIYSSPARMAAMQRYDEWAQKTLRDNPDMPPYLKGLVVITGTPFGAVLAASPAAMLLTSAFVSDNASKDGVNQNLWDQVWNQVSTTLGFSAYPALRFMAELTGLSNDHNIQAPLILPTDVRLAGTMIDMMSVLLRGEPGVPVWKDVWTWAANTGNRFLAGFVPGMEPTALSDPNLKFVDPVQAQIIADHPELLQQLAALTPGTEEYDTAVDALINATTDQSSPYWRDAMEKVAANNLFTASFNAVSPVYVSQFNPTKGMLGSATQAVSTAANATDAAVTAAEAANVVPATGVPGVGGAVAGAAVPTTADQGGAGATQPLGTTDWHTDPRWANHLTGGPAPDVRAGEQASLIYLANDLIGATPQLAAIIQAETHFHALGTDEERQAYADWYSIAYGQPLRTVDMGAGGKLSPADVTAMTADQRLALANNWAMTHAAKTGTPIVALIESYRGKKDVFKSSNPDWTQYDDWRSNVRAEVASGVYPSVQAWAQAQAQANPTYKRVYDDVQFRLARGEYDTDTAESRYLSVGGFLAYHGEQRNTTDPLPASAPLLGGGPGVSAGAGGGLSQDQLFQTIQAATNSGSGYNPAEAIRQDIATYTSSEMLTDTFLQAQGMRTPWSQMTPTEQHMWSNLLNQYGVPTPQLSQASQAYLGWVNQQPSGADVSAETYLADQQRLMLSRLGGGQASLGQTPRMPLPTQGPP